MQDLNIKKIQPTRGYVLVEPAKADEKTASGIILPENENEKPQHGTVLAVGEALCSCGCETDTKKSKTAKKTDSCCDDDCSCGCGSIPVKVGDRVIYKKWGGNEFKIDEIEYQFLKFEDILAVINN
jgi:chaperonin GroES